jgi:hypothetical protein
MPTKFDRTAFVPIQAFPIPPLLLTRRPSYPLRGWLALFDAGWSREKVANAWSTTAYPLTADNVDELLADVPTAPPVRAVPRLPTNQREAESLRVQMRAYFRSGWSIEQLAGHFFYYSPEVIAAIVGATPRKSRSKLDPRRRCLCGCRRHLTGRQHYASDKCRKKYARLARG